MMDDATRINRLIEGAVRRVPEQYFWQHRRFKSRPRRAADLSAIGCIPGAPVYLPQTSWAVAGEITRSIRRLPPPAVY